MKRYYKKIIMLLLIIFTLTACNTKTEVANNVYMETEAVKVSKEEKQKALNQELSEELNREIDEIISGKKMDCSVYVKNLKTGMSLEINDKEFVAASVIKLYNMITLYEEINKGNVVMTNNLEDNLRLMITESSNHASNVVVKAIGNGDFYKGAKMVTAFSKELGCTYTKEEHMLYDDVAPAVGRNRTSVKDCGLVLEQIYNKECISPEYDGEMIKLLKAQKKNYKLPQGLPEGTVIAHKTGENSRVEADVGIVYTDDYDYIICVSITSFQGQNPISVITDVSKCVYEFFERTNALYN